MAVLDLRGQGPESMPGQLADSLTEVNLRGCRWVTEAPSWPHQLLILNLMHTAIRNVGRLPSGLQELNAMDCAELEELPDPLPDGLIRLFVPQCPKISRLPRFPASLVELVASHCEALPALPDPLPDGLQEVSVVGCTSMRWLPHPLPRGLRGLFAGGSGLEVLSEVPDSLEELGVQGCRKLRRLPDRLPRLKRLNLTDCTGLEGIPELPETVETLILHRSGLARPAGLSDRVKVFGG